MVLIGSNHFQRLSLGKNPLNLSVPGATLSNTVTTAAFSKMGKILKKANPMYIVVHLGGNDIMNMARNLRLMDRTQSEIARQARPKLIADRLIYLMKILIKEIREIVGESTNIYVVDLFKRTGPNAQVYNNTRILFNSMMGSLEAKPIRCSKFLKNSHLSPDGVHLNENGNAILKKKLEAYI